MILSCEHDAACGASGEACCYYYQLLVILFTVCCSCVGGDFHSLDYSDS